MRTALNPRRFAALLCLLATVLTAAPLQAQMHDGVELVKADLLADTTAVAPGKPFTVGLRLRMTPHWHTYWQYSGDAGLPTKLTWQLPNGFKAGPLQWPLPEKIVTAGDIVNYGYDGEVVLLTEITPPASLPAGQITLKAKAEWLVCADICVPGSAELSLPLPAEGTPVAANAEAFAKYRALLPQSFDAKAAGFQVDRKVDGTNLVLTATTPEVLDFFPLPSDDADAGHAKIEHPSAQQTRITVPVTTGAADVKKLGGVLTLPGKTGGDTRIGWIIAPGTNAATSPATPNAAVPPVAKNGSLPPATGGSNGSSLAPGGSLFYFLLLGFVGGLILNVMPCVLPVISLKLFSFIKQSNEAPERVLRLGLAYSAGVFAWFLGFAALVVGFKAAGQQIGYAFHLQNPWFVVGLCVVTFVFALSLLGVFEVILPGSVTNAAGAAAGSREGVVGAFLQGVLATVLGSACLAPFLGASLGFAFSQSGLVIFAMFLAIAAGMSAPFLLISFNPRWLRFLPKPGLWMERVKQATGFLMLGTVLWLLSVLGAERGASAVVWTGVFLLACGVACWVQGTFNTLVASDRAHWASRFAIAALVVGGGWFSVTQIAESSLPEAAGSPFAAQLDGALKTGRPVFVDFTAAWCVNCIANERLVLDSDAVQKALHDRNAVFLKADYTSRTDAMTKLIKSFGRVGIPLYVLYPANKPNEPVVMPELLTQQIVLDAFTEADQRAKDTTKAVASR